MKKLLSVVCLFLLLLTFCCYLPSYTCSQFSTSISLKCTVSTDSTFSYDEDIEANCVISQQNESLQQSENLENKNGNSNKD